MASEDTEGPAAAGGDERLAAREQELPAAERRLQHVGEVIGEARDAADDVASQENVADEERRAASGDGSTAVPEEGQEVAPG